MAVYIRLLWKRIIRQLYAAAIIKQEYTINYVCAVQVPTHKKQIRGDTYRTRQPVFYVRYFNKKNFRQSLEMLHFVITLHVYEKKNKTKQLLYRFQVKILQSFYIHVAGVK
jgi:hypothetical protein